MMLTDKIINREFLTYLIVGGLTALIFFGFIALCIEAFQLGYRFAVSVAYLLAVSFHFMVNRKYTFRIEDNQLITQGLRYMGVLIINYLITIGVVSFFVDGLGVSTYLSAAISITVTVGVGYIASKYWVFRNREYFSD